MDILDIIASGCGISNYIPTVVFSPGGVPALTMEGLRSKKLTILIKKPQIF
jgi:hypothetical protein